MTRSLKTIIAILSACILSACFQPPTADTGLSVPEIGRSEVSEDPPAEPEALPPEQQVASITPKKRDAILDAERENGDVVGWLTVPGTDIDAPILKNPPGDNAFYTLHDFYGNPDPKGTYGADFRCSFEPADRDGISRNTTLYAHNLDENPDGEFFAQLKRYKDPAFAREHPLLFFSTEDEDMAWEVFAVYDAVTSFPYIQPNFTWEAFEQMLGFIQEASIYDYGITLTEDDKILTLSTCSYDVPGVGILPVHIQNDYRFVVMARLLKPDDAIVEEADPMLRDDILHPDSLPMIYGPDVDLFIYDGLECVNLNTLQTDGWDIHVDFNSLIAVGRIARGGVLMNPGEWEATKLAQGTVIYRNPEYRDILVADVDGAKTPYLMCREQYEIQSHTLRLENARGVIREWDLSSEALDALVDRMGGIPDPQPLADPPGDIPSGSDDTLIRIVTKDTVTCYTQTFRKGIPPSLGYEVTVMTQNDSAFLLPPEVFDRMVNTLS